MECRVFVCLVLLCASAAVADELPDPFKIVLIPDTQWYVDNEPPENNPFSVQTRWIRDHAEEENIRFAIHLGDIVEHGDDAAAAEEWQIADAAMSILEEGPNPVPYGMTIGNHDFTGTGAPDYERPAVNYNTYFGPQRFDGRPWYGGHKGTTNENSYSTFQVGDLDFLVLNLELLPTASTVAWANSVLNTHPDHRAIVSTHMYLSGSGSRLTQTSYVGVQGYNANQLFDNLIAPHDNVFMVVCGHLCYEALNVATNDSGGKVYEILSDYQNDGAGGSGWLRTLEFVPEDNEIIVGSYSPVLDQYNRGGSYTLDYDMGGETPVPDPPGPLSLVSYWNFEAGGYDLVGDNDLTLEGGATIAEGRFGSGLAVTENANGSAFAPADTSLDISDAFSVAMWVKYDGDNDAYGRVVSRMEDDSNGYNIAFASGTSSASDIIVRLKVDGTNYFVSSTGANLSRDEFHHVAFSFDAAAGPTATEKITVWIDGVAQSTIDTSNAGGVQGTTDFRLGKGTATSADFSGILDEVRFYRGVLGAAELAALLLGEELLPGDLDGDGFVGSGDLDAVRSNWGADVVPGEFRRGDADGDGYVGSADLDLVRATWGEGTPPTSVPEPTAMLLIITAAAALPVRRLLRKV